MKKCEEMSIFARKLSGISLLSFVFASGVYFYYDAYLLEGYEEHFYERVAYSAKVKRIFTPQSNGVLTQKHLVPSCTNILENITRGKWVKKVDLSQYKDKVKTLMEKEMLLDAELHDYWIKKGIQASFWRPDERCGYKIPEIIKPPNSTWNAVGSWCNAKGPRPCCSDMFNGTCMEPSEEYCNCPSCVDLRKYIHADVSDWVVEDSNCKWKNFSAMEACDVIENSPYRDIHFVGDSFVRNMFSAFVMLVTSNTTHGALRRSLPQRLKEKCTGRNKYYWLDCRSTLRNMSDTMSIDQLCGGRGAANFSVVSDAGYYRIEGKDKFLNLVKSLIGKSGSLIVLSIGVHMACIPDEVISEYLGPAINAIEDHYGGAAGPIKDSKLSGRWPQIIIALPLSIGLLKPISVLNRQNETICGMYSKTIKNYANKHDIRVLDFRRLTKMVHSFDGTHQGISVNLMKNQILLNFISSLNSR